MSDRLMSDAELRHRKKVQGHISQATGALGLAALGGTMAASRGGRNTLRKIPQLQSKVRAPKPKDPNRDRIQGATVPILATSAGLGGVGSFNFAAYTNAESRKRKQMAPVTKELGMDTGYFGEEGHPVLPTEIEALVEKAWTPTASNFDSERSREKRAKVYQGGSLVAAGAGGAFAGHQGLKAIETGKKIRPTKAMKVTAAHGGKALLGLAAVGGAAATHSAISRKRKDSWQPYAKRDTTSAFGIDHVEKGFNPFRATKIAKPATTASEDFAAAFSPGKPSKPSTLPKHAANRLQPRKTMAQLNVPAGKGPSKFRSPRPRDLG